MFHSFFYFILQYRMTMLKAISFSKIGMLKLKAKSYHLPSILVHFTFANKRVNVKFVVVVFHIVFEPKIQGPSG